MEQRSFDETPEEQQIEDGDLVPASFINKMRAHLHELLEEKKCELLKANPTLTMEALNAQVQIVDVYLRLSKYKNKKQPPAYLMQYQQPKSLNKHKETADSMQAQFITCFTCIKRQIEQGKLWKLEEVWQEIYEGPEYLHRPVLLEVRAKRIFKKKIHILLSRNRDRLARGKGQSFLIEEMKQYQVTFFSAKETENYDDTPDGDLMGYIYGYTSDKERQAAIDRINSTLGARTLMGKLNGSPDKLYGYSYNDDTGKRTIIEEEAEIVRFAFTSRAQGMSSNRIIGTLNERGYRTRNGNLWELKNLYDFFRTTEYMGVTYANKFITTYKHTGTKRVKHRVPNPNPTRMPDDVTPAIVSPELWHMVHVLVSSGTATSPRRQTHPEEYLLAPGFIRCTECGGAMITGHHTKRAKKDPQTVWHQHFYRCGKAEGKAWPCKGANINANVAHEEVYKFLEELCSDCSDLQEQLLALREEKSVMIDVDSLRAKVNSIQKQIDSLSDKVIMESDSDINAALRRQIARLRQNKLDQEEIIRDATETNSDNQSWVEDIDNFLLWATESGKDFRKKTYQEKRTVFTLLGLVVWIARTDNPDKDRIEITIRVQEGLQPTLPQGSKT